MHSGSNSEISPQIIGENDTTLFVGAHPDDIEVFHSELVQRAVSAGAHVIIALATKGEASTLNAHRFWQPDFVRNGKRAKEALQAAHRADISSKDIYQGDWPDGELTDKIQSIASWIGDITIARSVTTIVTPGPHGFDNHPDHTIMDKAALMAADSLWKHNRSLSLLRLDEEGEGNIILPVDRQEKIWRTIAHFSQFPGLRILGRFYLPPGTKNYLTLYEPLISGYESYTAYRNDSQSNNMYNNEDGEL